MSKEYLGADKKIAYGKEVTVFQSEDGSMSAVLMPYRRKKINFDPEKELDKDILDYFRKNQPPAGA